MIKYQQLLTEIIKGKTKWAEFKAELSEYNIDDRTEGLKDTSAGKIFEVFTKYYFLTAPEHIGQYEKVWLYDEIPLKVKEKLDLGTSRTREWICYSRSTVRRIYRSSISVSSQTMKAVSKVWSWR